MILYTGSASGTPVYCTPIGIDLRELVEGTDYAGYASGGHTTGASVQIYDEGGTNELKCVAFDMMTADGLSAVGNIEAASDLVPQMSIIEDSEDHFTQSEAFDTVTGAEPSDYALHRRDWYYKNIYHLTSGGLSEDLYYNLTAATEVWNSGNTYYKNDTYCNLFWTSSGGVFGAGSVIVKSGTTYHILASGGARVSKPGTLHVCYPTHVGEWEPRFRGIASDSMFPDIFEVTGRRLPSSYETQITQYSALTNKTRVVLCSFVYDDEEYFGVAVLAFGIDDSLIHCGCWGISAKWWNAPGSKYNYVVNPDGTSDKAINPHYTPSGQKWTQSTLPTNNGIVMGANYIEVDALTNTPYGYATFALTDSDFRSAIKSWTNKLTTFFGTMGDWFDRVRNSASYITGTAMTAVSNPIESILKAHTLPVPAYLLPTYSAASAKIPLVRSGGCDVTGMSTAHRLIDDLSRIVTVSCGSVYVGNKYNWFWDYTNSSCSLYVPFVGDVPLPVDEVLGHLIGCEYRIDIMTGDFICTISNDTQGKIKVLSGNCSIPVVCSSSATLQERALHSVSGAIQSGVQIAASASISNVPGVVSGLAGAAQSLSQSMQHNLAYSTIGGDGGLFSGLYHPVMMVTRPNVATGDVGSTAGYMSGTVGSLSLAQTEDGKSFVSVLAVDLDGVNASEAEKAEIYALLRKGVYV